MSGLNPAVNFNADPVSPGATTISDIIDAVNRQADQLDSFNDKLSFTAHGGFTIPWDGSAPFSDYGSFFHNLNYTPIYLMYYNLASEPGIWQLAANASRCDSGGLITMEFLTISTPTYVLATFNALVAGVAQNVNFKWFTLREPAQQA